MGPHPTRARESFDGDPVRQYHGDREAAFESLYRGYFPRLVRLCRRRTGDAALAEDLAQETLVRALAHLDDLEPNRPMWPWLKTVATRLAIDHARAHVRESGHEVPDGPAEDDEATTWREERALLLQALERVPRRHRVALTLRYLDEWTPAEVAEFLGLSRPAFEQLLFRARQTLRVQYRRVSGGALGVLAFPWRWLRRAHGRRLRAGNAFAPVTALQVTSGVLALALGFLAPAAAPNASAPPPVRAHLVIGAERVLRPVAAIPEQTPSRPGQAPGTAVGDTVQDLTDPNRHVEQPEDATIDGLTPSPAFARDHTVFASGTVHCRVAPCPPVLFRSTDAGVSWSRLAGAGLLGTQVLLPPAFGDDDSRIFVMGPNGLQVSGDGGKSFAAAVVGGLSYAVGSAAISPGFDTGDPSILIGAQMLLRYSARLGTIVPARYSALPGPLEPAYAPEYPADDRLVLGGVAADQNQGAAVSTVWTCSAAVCSQAPLAGESQVPKVRLAADFANSGVAYAFTESSVFVSTDAALAFRRIAGPWRGKIVGDVAMTNGFLYVAARDASGVGGALYISGDGGTSWTAASSQLFTRGLSHVVSVGSRVLVAFRDGGIACSQDDGHSWATRCAAPD